MNDKVFIVLAIYGVALIIILTSVIHLIKRKKESLCLCPGSGINKQCANCQNLEMGGSEYMTGNINKTSGNLREPKWPYDTLANGLTPQNRWRSCDTKCRGYTG